MSQTQSPNNTTSPSSSQQWSCTACTYDNQNTNYICEMCGTNCKKTYVTKKSTVDSNSKGIQFTDTKKTK